MLWSLGLGEPHAVSSLHGRGIRRPARRLVAIAAREGSRGRAAARPAPRRAARQAQRRQVEPAQPARRRVSASSSTRSPAPPSTRSTSWSRSQAPRGASSTPPASASRVHGGERPRVLRLPADQGRAGQGRGGRRAPRGARAHGRAGRPHPLDGRRERAGARARVQQVGPDRRGAPQVPRARDRARPAPGGVGAAGQHQRHDRAAHGEARARAATRRSRAGRRACRRRSLNAFLASSSQSHPHPVRGGKQPRILFGTQATTKPPTFVLFTSGFLEAGYRRFIERRLREEFGFVGTPMRVNLRVRRSVAGRRRRPVSSARTAWGNLRGRRG